MLRYFISFFVMYRKYKSIIMYNVLHTKLN